MSVRRLLRRTTTLLLLLLIFLTLVPPSESDELQSLLKFKSALQKNSPTNVFTSWTQDSSSVCKFAGVSCNSDGFVSEINVPHKNLSGVLPFDSICSLKSLQKLSLASNSLFGAVTEDIKNCTTLQLLDLGFNSFSGQVPDLSSLRELRFLSLNSSGFSGSFPWKSLENLTNLEFLSLGDNPFLATKSFPEEILKLNKLYWLYLTNCSIGGQITDGIGNLTLLQNLELSDNNLSGEIPPGIANLANLTQLEIYNNALTGKLPDGFRNLRSLLKFDASENKLEGDLSELRFLTQLTSIQLFDNQLSGEVPEEFGEFKDLSALSLYKNSLTGSLPQKLGSWSGMDYIDVSENFLSGPIPPGMCKNAHMHDLLLLQNNFTGSFPESYVNCSSLIRLRVSNNSLSGSVPDGIWSLPNVLIIDLSINWFEGPVGSDVGKAKSLAQLFLSRNRFSGELPSEISGASLLVSIQLSSNNFSGKIPETIGELKKLNSLWLDGNMFSGPIPDSIGSCVSLTDINLSGNSFSGEIPASLASLHTLNSLNLSGNKLSGEIPTSLSSLRLSLLDLSNNQLVGCVPESLSVLAYNGSFAGNSGLFSPNVVCSTESRPKSRLRTILSCFSGGAIVLLICIACFMFVKPRHNSNLDQSLKSHSWDFKSYHVLSFDEKEIIDAIKKENLIGKGGSGNVYKVVLSNGKQLAVKHIWMSESSNCQSSSAMLSKRKFLSREFDAEVATLSSVRHVNVVKLYCSITSEDSNLLVYEYFPNGSLWDRLHACEDKNMTWEIRYEVALGAAKGLEYLHHGCDRPVIHRDVKSSNILVDEEWKPRIADFGLAKIVQAGGGDWTHVIAGTYGYIAPEYAYTFKVNEKSDVYSFGVVLMELVTGKRPIEPEFGENKDIVHWVCSKVRSGELDHVVDSTLSESSKEDAMKVLKIAIHCTAKMPVLRPSMLTVLQMLEEAEPCRLTDIVVSKDRERD